MRDHDAPTKYVFNGSTRVARVTGSLSSNQRVQRVRVWQGWNLCSLAVTATNLVSQILNTQPDISAFRWDRAASNWLTILPTETLTAGAVLWLRTISNATLRLTGTYSDPTNQTVGTNGDYLPCVGLEVWDFKSAISNLCCTGTWSFDAQAARWHSWLAPPLKQQSELPAFLAPGEAVFLRADGPVRVEVPTSALRIRYYHQDHLGSSTCLSDATGGLLEALANYPFGAPRSEFRNHQLIEAYSFGQKERDRESRLDYFETRYMFADIGNFISCDGTISQLLNSDLTRPQNLHVYAYGRRNPLVFVDTDGRDPSLATAARAYVGSSYARDTIGALGMVNSSGNITFYCSSFIRHLLDEKGYDTEVSDQMETTTKMKDLIVERNSRTTVIRESATYNKNPDVRAFQAGDIVYLDRKTKSGYGGHWGVVAQGSDGKLTLIHAGSPQTGVAEVDLVGKLNEWRAGAEKGTAKYGVLRMDPLDTKQLPVNIGAIYDAAYSAVVTADQRRTHQEHLREELGAEHVSGPSRWIAP